jgi:glutathione-regulated potassium-efflux system ancillary protein KefG
VNGELARAARELSGVTVRDLYEEYPTLYIDVPREQALLLEHDVIVFQHPFYWYSAPAILKEWQDLVLEHGWAYGHGGDQLRGKVTFNAVTTGGPASAYQKNGYNRFTMRELLAPFDQTAHLCGMRFLAPFVVHASLRVAGAKDVEPHALAYQRLLAALQEGELDVEKAGAASTLNHAFESLLRAAPGAS